MGAVSRSEGVSEATGGTDDDGNSDVVVYGPVQTLTWQRHVRESKTLRGQLLATAFIVSTYSTGNTGRDVRPAMATVGEALGINRTGAGRYVSRLVTLGWLREVGKHAKGVKVYELTSPTPIGS